MTVRFLTHNFGVLLIFLSAIATGCRQGNNIEDNRLKVVCTTTMISDLISEIAGENVLLYGLMKPGSDPHSYKARESDVFRLWESDIIFYNGLHLEGKMEDLFVKMNRYGKKTVAISSVLDKNDLINVNTNLYDPHIWFSIKNWKKIAQFVASELSMLDTVHSELYQKRLMHYLIRLDSLDRWIRTQLEEIPPMRRILITSHDAFGYFGRDYGFKVIGIQGINPVSEAGINHIRFLADLIVEKKIPAVFTETSVSDRSVRALQEAVESRSFQVIKGGTLYSDALGLPGSSGGSYIEMYKTNIITIREALK